MSTYDAPSPTRTRVAIAFVGLVLVALALLALFFKWQLDLSDERQSGRSDYVACVSKLPLDSIKALDQIVLDGVVTRHFDNLTEHEQDLKDAITALEEIDKRCPPPE